MSTHKKKKKKSLLSSTFYRVYFAVVAVALIAILAGAIWFNGYLKDYEAAQPVYVAEDVAQLFEDGDYERIYALDSNAGAFDGDKERYVESLTALTEGGNVNWDAAFSASADEKVYNVTLDGSKLASFTLVPSGQTNARGMKLWRLGNITTNVQVEAEAPEDDAQDDGDEPIVRMQCTVTVPSDYSVTVNGEAMTDDDLLQSDIPAVISGFLPAGVETPTLKRYGFASGDEAPQITVTDPDGAEQQVRQDSEYAWSCGLPDNVEFRETYAKAIFSVAQSMAKYTSKDLSRSKMLRYVKDDSPAEAIIRSFSNYWALQHKSVSFENVQLYDCYFYSDTCFSCGVSFDYVLHTRKSGNRVYPTTYNFCFVKEGNGAKLYSFTLN